MSKKRSPNWKYIYSDYFKENIAIHKETGWVYFEKGAQYSPEEIKLLADNGLQFDIATHNVKTIIGGEIVGIEKTPEKKPIIIENKGAAFFEEMANQLEIW
jgi:hypothetical protein